MAALIAGLFVGAFRLIIEIQSKSEKISNIVLQNFASINFLHFAVYLFILSSFVLVIVSLLTEKPAEEKLTGLITIGLQLKKKVSGELSIFLFRYFW